MLAYHTHMEWLNHEAAAVFKAGEKNQAESRFYTDYKDFIPSSSCVVGVGISTIYFNMP